MHDIIGGCAGCGPGDGRTPIRTNKYNNLFEVIVPYISNVFNNTV